MDRLRILFSSLLLVIPLLLQAQMNVSGIVTEKSSGDPLPGVNIIIAGTQTGTSTDFDGKYQLTNVPKKAILIFSFMGYKTVKIPATSTIINVQMVEDSQNLKEVIIVGYGASKKEDLTGSVNKITTKDFNKGPVTSAQSLLTGKVSGVTVVAPSGAPGEGAQINIRGLSSLSLTNDPLYVVDGVPIGGGISGSRDNLNFINPNDIASIVILKDASATAIYGSRAANGVVLITTKKGKKKDFAFQYDVRQSFSTPYKYVNMLNSYQFEQLVHDTGDQATIDQLGIVDPNDPTNRKIYRTDWQKEIYQSAIANEHNFSATGDVFHIPLRLSIGHIDQDGILKTDNFQRTTAALNLNPSLLDDHLKISISARGMYTENHFANRGAIGSANLFDPTKPVKDDTSPFAGYYAWIDTNTNLQYNLSPTNPVALIDLTNDFSFVKRVVGNAKFDYKLHFFPDITASVNVGIDKAVSNGHSISSPDMPTSDASWQGVHNTYSGDNTNKLFDAYLTYNKEINKHGIKIMLGHSYQSFDYSNDFYDDYKKQHNMEDYNQVDLSRKVLFSYFGRVNYKFNDKYLLTATLRADATSVIRKELRWGYFPSMALAWNVHKEDFMKNAGFDELKLRVGYGEVGNVNGLAPYKYLTRYQISTSTAAYQFGSDYYNTYRPEPTNKNISWEVGRTTNIGVDFSILKRRLSGSINFYNKETKNLIIYALVDPFTNFGNRVESNVGDMTNKGVELELSGLPVKTDKLKWRINYNFTYNNNKVAYMPFDQEVGGIEGGVGNTVQTHTQGQTPYSFYVYQQVYDTEGKPIEGVYVDRNKDGIINNKDKYYMGSPFADVLMGLSSTLTYKNFDMSISTRASFGNYIYNNVASSKSIPANLTSRPFLTNIHSDYYNTNFQNFTETNLLSDYYVQDASFFKIDNVSLGYRFPKFYKNMNVHFYANLQNVATLTKYKGLDPEIGGGIDNNFYPRPRTFSFGFNLDF